MITTEEIYQAKIQLYKLLYEHWKTQELFTHSWWGMIMFIIFLYIFVFYLIDKKRFLQIMFFGSLMAVSGSVIDAIGTSYVLWSNSIRFFPITPGLFLYDLTAIPLYYMLAYQYTSSWISFVLWSTIISTIYSLIFLPFLAVFKIYTNHSWNNIYFIPMLLGVSILARIIVLKIMKIEKDAN